MVVVKEEDYTYLNALIVMSTAAVVTVNVGADRTSVHPLRDWWDRSGGVVVGMNTGDGRDIEAPRLVP